MVLLRARVRAERARSRGAALAMAEARTETMRFGLATTIGVTVLPLAIHSGCLPSEDCSSPGASVKTCQNTFEVGAHVSGTAASLAGARVKFCRNGDCASATVGIPAMEGGTFAYAALTGAAFSADTSLSDEGDGFTVVDISLVTSGLTLTDGDTYSVTITDAAGKTLLDVSRPVTYDVDHACRQTCLEYSMQVYPTSPSGISCGDKVCGSGIGFEGKMTTSDARTPFLVSLCRNGACATNSSTVGPNPTMPDTLGGAFTGNYGIELLKGQTYDFQVSTLDDPAALSAGDVYTLTIKQGTATLATWSGPAPYQTTFPNGMQCDSLACRYASIVVP
jgi:hypothetical protein